METVLYGHITKPVVAMIGSWDPLVPEYFKMIDTANKYCEDASYELLIVLLDPLPENFLFDKINPIYDSWQARVQLLMNTCKGAVCKVSMDKSITNGGVQQFLPKLKSYFDIAELWLKHGQTLGSGPQNLTNDIAALCRKLNIQYRHMKRNNILADSCNKVKNLLTIGDIQAATEITGHPPLWQRGPAEQLAIGWKPGLYGCRAVKILPGNKIELGQKDGKIEVFHNDHGHAVFCWPDEETDIIALNND